MINKLDLQNLNIQGYVLDLRACSHECRIHDDNVYYINFNGINLIGRSLGTRNTTVIWNIIIECFYKDDDLCKTVINFRNQKGDGILSFNTIFEFNDSIILKSKILNYLQFCINDYLTSRFLSCNLVLRNDLVNDEKFDTVNPYK